jgi:hypothetical protein
MKRLYTFGCSFTQYNWPTWADILGREFDYYENWGQGGAGNQFIFNSLIECLVKNKLTNNDQIIIMWTNVSREDRYVNDRWITSGNIFTQVEYSEEFIKKYADEKGYLLRDLALIHAAKKMLEQYSVPYIFTSMVPVDNSDQYNISPIKGVTEILDAYKETIESIRPSVFETVFKFDWLSRDLFVENTEYQLDYKKIYNNVAGSDWPSYENYKSKNFSNTPRSILEEIKNFFSTKSFKKDLHPLPIEHLEYLDLVLPEFTVGDLTRSWVNEITQKIVFHQHYDNLWNAEQFTAKRW